MAAHPEPVEGSDIVKVTKDIAAVEAEIKNVEAKIDAVEEKIDGENDPEEKKALREDKKALREDKKALREKEKALRKKELFLLQRGTGVKRTAEEDERFVKRLKKEIVQPLQETLEKRLDSLQESIAADAPTPQTRASAGQQQLAKCVLKQDLRDVVSSGSSLFVDVPAKGKEDAVMEVILGRLREVVKDVDGALVVGDSQNCKWIPQPSKVANQNLKPDGFVLHGLLVKSGDSGQQPALPSLFGCLRCVVEGKAKDAHGTDATGQAHMYAQNLKKHVRLLNILLIDHEKFRAERWDHGELVSVVDGSLIEDGSKAFIADFLCGPPIDGCLVVHPLEQALRDVSWGSLGFSVDPQRPVLGVGGSAVVLGGQWNNEPAAAKVVRQDKQGLLRDEVVMYNTLQMKGHAAVSKLIHHLHGVLIIQPVGSPLKRNREDTVKGLEALRSLHAVGVCHGDARVANFIRADDEALCVDFSHARELSTELDISLRQRCSDIAQFLADASRTSFPKNDKVSWESAFSEDRVDAILAYAKLDIKQKWLGEECKLANTFL